jgi:hypothetical protein
MVPVNEYDKRNILMTTAIGCQGDEDGTIYMNSSKYDIELSQRYLSEWQVEFLRQHLKIFFQRNHFTA